MRPRKAAEDAEIERKAKEQECIDAAVKAEREKNEKELAALKSQYAAAGRSPMGGLGPEARRTPRHPQVRRVVGSRSGVHHDAALGEHGKTVSQPGLQGPGHQDRLTRARPSTFSGKAASGRRMPATICSKWHRPGALPGCGQVQRGQPLTLASGGDEWVGVEYSRRLWPAIRQATWVLQKLPTRNCRRARRASLSAGIQRSHVLQGRADDRRERRPRPRNASVPSSKLSTAKQTLTVDKLGGRSQYAGEMEEDSLIPWASRLNAQMTIAATETLEHVAIDGDTETGATTNINTIGGTCRDRGLPHPERLPQAGARDQHGQLDQHRRAFADTTFPPSRT